MPKSTERGSKCTENAETTENMAKLLKKPQATDKCQKLL